MRALIFLLLLLPLMSCGAHKKRNKLPPGAIAVVNSTVFTRSRLLSDNKTVLYFPEGLPKSERDALTEACEHQLKAFEKDWGSPSRPVNVYFFDEWAIPCGRREGEFWGCYYVGGDIHLITGYGRSNNIAPALYHELVHLNIPGHDVEHTDPMWAAFWEPRQAELNNELRR